MKKYALIGRTLGHSYSQQWFTDLFKRLGLDDHSYCLCEMEKVERLREWVSEEGICGMNVTVPFKRDVIPLLDGLDEAAAAIGAVNCITVEGGRLIGHNTDAPAFTETLIHFLSTLHSPLSALRSPLSTLHSPLILGTGGAARAVAYALQGLGAKPTLVSRNPEAVHYCHYTVISYDGLSTLNPKLSTLNSQLIINATPVGMYPDIDATPLDSAQLSSLIAHHSSLVYDLIYNPSPTLLMKMAAERGAKVTDGLAMLHRQAELSWDFFRKNTPY